MAFLAACSDDETAPATGTGGGGATSTGGSSGNTGGAAGSTGGKATGGSSGAGGSATGGSSGAGGSATGGSSGAGGSATGGSTGDGGPDGAPAGGAGGRGGGAGAGGAPGDAGTPCTAYCSAQEDKCGFGTTGTNQFANVGDCMAACAQYATTGNDGDSSGDTLQCRVQHLSFIPAQSATVHCPHTGENPTSQCVN